MLRFRRLVLLLLYSSCAEAPISTSSSTRAVVAGSWSAIDAGRNFACGIRAGDSALLCWGANGASQLGSAAGPDRALPVQVGSMAWSAVSSGGRHACGLSGGGLYCWGANNRGQVGNGATTPAVSVPTRIGSNNDWVSVSTGFEHTCGARRTAVGTGQLFCWGNAAALGTNTGDRNVPTAVAISGVDWVSATSGQQHSCGLAASGEAYCWGNGIQGQIGDGVSSARFTPVRIGGANRYVSIDAGDVHNCALRTTGAIDCWGSSANGALGLGATVYMALPTTVGTATDWASVNSGYMHTCATKTNGELWCWGSNSTGQLGDPSVVQQTAPQRFGTESDWIAVNGSSASCAIHAGGVLECWGSNARGELGLGVLANKTQPARAGTLRTWRAVSSGGYHTCAIKQDGTLHCFGSDFNAQLGDGDALIGKQTPIQVGTWNDWQQVSAGLRHTCALRAGGALYCWGGYNGGPIGVGSAPGIYGTPQAIAGTWANVSVGAAHTCGVRTDGSLWCWGMNYYGELGDNSITFRTSPVLVANGYTSVYAGQYFSCGIRADGRLLCWGRNNAGQLGIGNTTDVRVPTLSTDSSTYRVLAAGASHTCGVRTSGEVACWGSNSTGQIAANVTTAMRTSPAAIDTRTDYAAVTAGNAHTCVTRPAGTYCFGGNSSGQLGDGTYSSRIVPTLVLGTPATWTSVSAGFAATCAVREGSLYCWGDNSSGQLGDGSAWSNSKVDECLQGTHNCSGDATCTDLSTSFSCACNPGFGGDGVTCAEVDECLTNNGGCSPNATCADAPGSSPVCACNAGYAGNGFTCAVCPAGYVGNGVTCIDVDECATNNGGCSAQAACTNSVGSFSCACNAGYSGNGVSCTDVDECLVNNGGCSVSATCTNVPGSSSCVCNTGYVGDGVVCEDVDECAVDNGGCAGYCNNTPGSHVCGCPPGYSGDGITCVDIDECATNNGGCGANTVCTNSTGSFACSCANGWDDCDQNTANGCEVDLLSSNTNCGACGTTCTAPFGVCSNAACNYDCTQDQVAGLPASGMFSTNAVWDYVPLCSGEILYGDRTTNQIIHRDLPRNTVRATYQLTAQPSDLELDREHGYLYVAQSSTFIVRIDLRTGAQVSIQVPNVPYSIAVGEDGLVFAVTGPSNQYFPPLTIIDGLNATVLATIPYSHTSARFARLLAYDHVNHKLFAADHGLSPSSIIRFGFNPATLAVTQEQVLRTSGSYGTELRISPDGSHLAHPCGSGNGYGTNIADFRPLDLAVIEGVWDTGSSINGARFSRDGTMIATTTRTNLDVYDVLTHVRLNRYTPTRCSTSTEERADLSRGQRIVYRLERCGSGGATSRIYWYLR